MKVISKQPDYYDYIYASLETETDEKTVFYKRDEVCVKNFINDNASESNKHCIELETKIPEQDREKYIEKYKKHSELIIKKFREKGIQINFDIYSGSIFSSNKINLSKNRQEFQYIVTKILFVAGKTNVLFDIYERKKVNNEFKETILHSNLNFKEMKNIVEKDMAKYLFDFIFKEYEKLDDFDCTNFLIEMEVPIITIEVGLNENKIRFNSTLKRYDYDKISDPYTIHQDIEQFIAQNLTKREIVSEVSNELKIINHGFDTKKSFRHR